MAEEIPLVELKILCCQTCYELRDTLAPGYVCKVKGCHFFGLPQSVARKTLIDIGHSAGIQNVLLRRYDPVCDKFL
jgi:hypothetical protein